MDQPGLGLMPSGNFGEGNFLSLIPLKVYGTVFQPSMISVCPLPTLPIPVRIPEREDSFQWPDFGVSWLKAYFERPEVFLVLPIPSILFYTYSVVPGIYLVKYIIMILSQILIQSAIIIQDLETPELWRTPFSCPLEYCGSGGIITGQRNTLRWKTFKRAIWKNMMSKYSTMLENGW